MNQIPPNRSEVKEDSYAWVAEKTALTCPICLTSEHVEALHGCKDYDSILLTVVELYCQLHKIRIATFPVGDAIDPY